MYANCIFCEQRLGANQIIEAFPVGRSLAFDPAKGRLWVICPRCRRWNLSPIEERWEAVETCEKTFRALPTRVHSQEVGAAVHPEGLRLVRIGEPLPVEFASVRYGESMGRRMRRAVFWGATATTAGVLIAVSGAATGFAGGLILGQAPGLVHNVQRFLASVSVPLGDGRWVRLRGGRIYRATLLNPTPDQPFGLRFPYKGGEAVLYGDAAHRAAARLMPAVNSFGARRKTVQTSVARMMDAGGPEGFLQATWGRARPRPNSSIRWVMSKDMKGGLLNGLPPTTRLALEMALHEEQERRALEGQLAELKAAWRDAEAIAKISDDLLLPARITDFLEEKRPGQLDDIAAGSPTSPPASTPGPGSRS